MVLRRDGYELVIAREESTYPVYEVRQIRRGVQGAGKNLIFASNGPKPELGSLTPSTTTSWCCPTPTVA